MLVRVFILIENYLTPIVRLTLQNLIVPARNAQYAV